jgi:cholesterol oxidase
MSFEKKLQRLSGRLGALSRSNSESLVGAYANDAKVDYSQGVAITSSFFPDEHTHVEPVRYGKGSNLMALLSTILTDEVPGVPRWRTWLLLTLKAPLRTLRHLWVRGWSERAVIALVMQNLENSLTVFAKPKFLTGGFRLSSKQGEGEPNPSYIPEANETAKTLAKVIGGRPLGNLGDLISTPFTAHFVGGAVIGETPTTGVVDPYQRVWGYPNLTISDGSVIPANLGVNPSLTITALAERTFAMWPNRGDLDHRPPQGDPYRRVDAVAPINPAVPADAVGALRLARDG